MAYPKRKPTHGSASLTTASASVLPANSERKYAELFNASDVTIWLAVGVPAAIGVGVMCPAGASWVIDGDNLTHAEIFGHAAVGAAKLMTYLEMS